MSNHSESIAELQQQAHEGEQERLKAKPKIYEISDDEVEWAELEKKWDQQNEDDVMSIINRGRKGLNEGLGNGLVNINQFIHGTHRARYVLVGADSGVGKTTLVDFMYLYSLWLDCRRRGIKLHVKYFSFELSRAEKKIRWISQWIKHVYKKDMPSDYIAGRIPGLLLSDEDMKMVMRAYGIIEEMMMDIDMVDNMLHPTGMLMRVIEHFEANGKVTRDPSKFKDDPKNKGKQIEVKGMIRSYKPNNPTDMTVVIVDHLALINVESNITDTKSLIDRWSMYSVQLRNIFQATIINIQQFNINQMSAYREQKRSENAIAPQRLDFGDSTYTYRDADLVYGLVKPVLYSLKTYMGFPLEDLMGYFLALHLMKNRYGVGDKMVPLFINPIAGVFYDMPFNPHERNSMGQLKLEFYTNEATRLEKICQHYSSQQGTTP